MYHQSLSKDGCNVSTYFPSVITRNKWYSMIIHVQKKNKNGGKSDNNPRPRIYAVVKFKH